jgi:hypothetical protein
MSRLSAERTLGVSPKVIWPALVGAVLSTVLLVLGALRGSRTLRDAGAGALGATAAGAALGYTAPPGPVVPPDHDVTEMHETEQAEHPMPDAEAAAEPAAVTP